MPVPPYRTNPEFIAAMNRYRQKTFLASVEITPESLEQYRARKIKEGDTENEYTSIGDRLSETQRGLAIQVITAHSTTPGNMNRHFEERVFLDYELETLQSRGLVAIVQAQRQELGRANGRVTCVYYGIPVGVSVSSKGGIHE